MLELGLAQLERHGKVRIDESVPEDDAVWEGTELRPSRPLRAVLIAQRAGHDVVIRGTISGGLSYECRRCLAPVDHELDEEVSLVFRAGIDRFEADRDGVYALPASARVLDLSEPVREHVLLAAPLFATCSESCRGLCPHCGVNLNEETCNCTVEDVDARWAALRNLKLD